MAVILGVVVTVLQEIFTSIQNSHGRNDGKAAECAIARKCKRVLKRGRVLRNVYIPFEDNFTEVDVIYIHKSGIYVFESKDYSGDIYGHENDPHWHWYSPVKKYQFYNPIKQNWAHVLSLCALIGEEWRNKMFPIVVFGKYATLRRVTVSPKNAYVVHFNSLSSLLRKLSKQSDNMIAPEDIERLYTTLLPYTRVSREQKQAHIKFVQERSRK